METKRAESPASEGLQRGRNELPPGSTLRNWLRHLEGKGNLAVARPGVKLAFELAGIANRFDGHKATFFPAPDGHDKPVVSGIVSDRHWMAEALGVPERELLQRFQRAMADPIAPHEITAPPCQEVVHDKVDLSALLPIPTHNELDSGPYITAGLIIVRNPQTGIQNVAIVRLQVSGGNRLGALILPRHTLAFNEMAEREGNDLPVAIVIGRQSG